QAGLVLVRGLEDKIQSLVEQGFSLQDAVKEVGGEAFLRQAGAAWRAGTMPHWQLWSGIENCLAHTSKPTMSLSQFVRTGAEREFSQFRNQNLTTLVPSAV